MIRIVLLSIVIFITGCQIPQDPELTLKKIRNGTMRIGASAHPPQVIIDNGNVSGIEADLMKGFAEEQNAAIEWVAGSESELMEKLERFELDAVIGGFGKKTIWKKKAGLTKTYDYQHHVIAIPKGENALLKALESYITTHKPVK